MPSRPPKQVSRQLRTSEAIELARDYEAGASLKELASRYRIHQHTVSAILDRQGVPRRGKKLDRYRTAVILAYEGGDSFATLAARYGVNPETVRRALITAGVILRPQGWNGR
jgi:Mor family transcriptional regulator